MRRSLLSQLIPASWVNATRVLAACVLAVVALLGVGTPSAEARQSADYVVTAEVDGDRVAVSISELSTAIGSLQLELRGVPELITEECALISGLGACAQADDVVRIVALNPTGWQEPTLLVELEFAADASDAELVVERGTDVQGVDLVGQAATSILGSTSGADAGSGSGSDSGSGSGSGVGRWVIVGVAGIAVVGLLAALTWKRRGPRQDPHTP